MAKDYYDILGVEKNATKSDVKRAYRRLAQKYHPDKGEGGDAGKFREVNEAYEVLSDDTKRKQYDQFGQTFEQAGAQGAGGFGGFGGFENVSDFMRGFGQNYQGGPYSGIEFDFGDIFSDIFGSPRKKRRTRGVDLEVGIEIDFLDSVFGTEKKIRVRKKDACERCDGSGGEPGTNVETCSKCHGQGQIVQHQRTILGSMQRYATCDQCKGRGKIPEKPCTECRGDGIKEREKEITVIIPPGIDDGQRIKMTGEGEIGYRGSDPGDLYIVVRVTPHEEFVRDGFDVISEIPISFYQAALGARIEANTVDGAVEVKIPAGIQSGKVLRLKGKGVPHYEGGKRGDHLLRIRVVTPQKLSKKEKEIFKKLAEENGETVDIDEGLWDRIKGSFEG